MDKNIDEIDKDTEWERGRKTQWTVTQTETDKEQNEKGLDTGRVSYTDSQISYSSQFSTRPTHKQMSPVV